MMVMGDPQGTQHDNSIFLYDKQKRESIVQSSFEKEEKKNDRKQWVRIRRLLNVVIVGGASGYVPDHRQL